MKNLWKWITGWWKKGKVVEPPKTPETPVKPEKKPIIRKCIQTDKFMFTREQAQTKRDELEKKTINEYLRIYCCEFCGFWHLTHRKKYRW